MNNIKIILVFLLLYNQTFSQEEFSNEDDFPAPTACEKADSNLIYAYSNVKSAYKSNNISHLKYYSDKALKSFEKAKINVKTCGCEKALELAIKGADLMARVEPSETFEDGRFFVKRAKDIAQESITQLNECTTTEDEIIEEDVKEDTNDIASTENDLAALQREKDKLEQLKLDLKRKQEAIEQKLANQKEKASKLEKEKVINKYENALALNIKTYNDVLSMYGSTSFLRYNKASKTVLLSKSNKEIKTYYLDNVKTITVTYLEKLDLCTIK